MAGMKIWGVVLAICFAAAAAGVVCGQPMIEYKEGKLEDLRGMRRFYVIAPSPGDRAAIAKQMNGRQGLRLMRHGTTAQFHVTFGCSRWGGAPPEDPSTIELRVSIPKPDPVIVNVWFKEEKVPNCKNAAAKTSLVKQFLKDFTEMNRRK